MAIEHLKQGFSIDQERLKLLEQVIPEAFVDGKINWETLKEVLGEYLEDDAPGAEHFGLKWHGKRETRRLASLPSKGTLIPVPEEGTNEGSASNVFIEGDNLEVLKLLQKSYASRIKMIYIDPPYNTGNDFIYKDNFTENLDNYLSLTNQVDEEGRHLTTNPRSDGRFHTNWLNMVYPRLRLARNLLSNDGVIFVSIDDNEFHHLRIVMNEIFGDENFIGVFNWQSKKGGGGDSGGVVRDQEYIICFSKDSEYGPLSRVMVTAEVLNEIDKKGTYRRSRELNKWGSNSRREDRPTMYFPIPGPSGEDVFPIRNDGTEGRWRLGKEKMFSIVKRGDADYVRRDDGTYIVYEKVRSSEPRTKPFRTWLPDVGTTADGSKVVKELFKGKKVFDFPKPVDLIKKLVSIGTTNEEEHIVLDFFAGSATTAQAVIEKNREDGGNRKFIMVQLQEPCPKDSEGFKASYKSISDISKDRIRKIYARIREEMASQLPLEEQEIDLGFKVFCLKSSNVKVWKDYKGDDVQELQTTFLDFQTPLIEGWKESDVVTEITLIEGFPLDCRITHLIQFESNRVLIVESGFVEHRLFITLDARITDETIQQLQLSRSEDIFICLDSALTDEVKLQMADTCNIKTI